MARTRDLELQEELKSDREIEGGKIMIFDEIIMTQDKETEFGSLETMEDRLENQREDLDQLEMETEFLNNIRIRPRHHETGLSSGDGKTKPVRDVSRATRRRN